ncbi:MAG TPA: hypothetical protein VFF26_12155 [Gallionella sp.]|nr:hypothetical protein [Gallionella sp.]
MKIFYFISVVMDRISSFASLERSPLGENVRGGRGEEIVMVPPVGNHFLSRHLFALLLGAFAGNAVAQDVQPAAEQLLAATVSIGDFKEARIPGDWSDAGPSGCLGKNPEPGLLNCIGSNFVGWPARENIAASSAVNLFADAATAATAFNTRLDGDKEYYGGVATGPALGEESRYHARPAKGKDTAVTMVRLRHGRYLVLVKAESSTKPLAQKVLANLAKRVIARLDRIDAGTLRSPALPPLAKVLPDADNSLTHVITASGPSDWWAFAREDGQSPPSKALRRVLHRGIGNQKGVVRTYSLKDIPNHTVHVSVFPFRNEDAAKDYLTVAIPSEPKGGEVIFRGPGVGGYAPWEMNLTLRVGSHVVEVLCISEDDVVAPGCESVIRKLGEQVKARLGS